MGAMEDFQGRKNFKWENLWDEERNKAVQVKEWVTAKSWDWEWVCCGEDGKWRDGADWNAIELIEQDQTREGLEISVPFTCCGP